MPGLRRGRLDQPIIFGMCQLLGLNCNHPTDATFSFSGFTRRAGITDHHSDGWGIAFFEYCIMVPANRWGYQDGYNAFQLKIVQEVITLSVFTVFAVMYLKEPFETKYLLSFACMIGAVYFAFLKKALFGCTHFQLYEARNHQ